MSGDVEEIRRQELLCLFFFITDVDDEIYRILFLSELGEPGKKIKIPIDKHIFDQILSSSCARDATGEKFFSVDFGQLQYFRTFPLQFYLPLLHKKQIILLSWYVDFCELRKSISFQNITLKLRFKKERIHYEQMRSVKVAKCCTFLNSITFTKSNGKNNNNCKNENNDKSREEG
jgi:hypothetical protein